MSDWWDILGGGVIILFLIFIVCLPLICTIVLGTYFATLLGLTGIVWWSFVILFLIVLMLLITFLGKAK
nr:MAG TPA: hypothetical protein [Caudoviricetes sp.]